MSRYFLEIAFDGSGFHGWQIQPNALTVQEEINKALGVLLQDSSLETVGCGRTDTGVHAKQFFVHFDTDSINDLDKFAFRLNGILPNSISVSRLIPVKEEQHARFDATKRTYTYHLHQQKDPFLWGKSMFFPQALDMELMNDAARILLDTVDFSSFSKSHTQTYTNNCDVSLAKWEQRENRWVFTISADRFLRNMVRAVVGTLLEVGQGKITKSQFQEIIDGRDRRQAGYSVEACGLYLERIEYPYISNEAE